MKFIVVFPRWSRIYAAFFARYNFALILKYQVCLGGEEESLQNISFCILLYLFQGETLETVTQATLCLFTAQPQLADQVIYVCKTIGTTY